MINVGELTGEKIEEREYMVYICKEDEVIDMCELEMLSQNQIPGVCPFEEQIKDNKRYFYYDVTGMMTLKKYLEKCEDKALLEQLCKNMEQVLKMAGEYFLYPQHFIGALEWIMVKEGKPVFLVLPVTRYNQAQMSYADMVAPLQKMISADASIADTERTEDVEEFESRTEDLQKMFSILQNSTGNHFYVNKPVFRLGRDGHQVDFAIRNPVVGRVHATLYVENEELYLVDEESKNGTYAGNDRLKSGERVKLVSGDVFRLGTEEFTVE